MIAFFAQAVATLISVFVSLMTLQALAPIGAILWFAIFSSHAVAYGEGILLGKVYPLLLGMMGLDTNSDVFVPVLQILTLIFILLWVLQYALTNLPFFRDKIQLPNLFENIGRAYLYAMIATYAGTTFFLAAEQIRIAVPTLINKSVMVEVEKIKADMNLNTPSKRPFVQDACSLSNTCTMSTEDFDGVSCDLGGDLGSMGSDGLTKVPVACDYSPVDILANYMNVDKTVGYNPEQMLATLKLDSNAISSINSFDDLGSLIAVWKKIPGFVFGAYFLAVPAILYLIVNFMLSFSALLLFLSIPIGIPFMVFQTFGDPIEEVFSAYGKLFFFTLTSSIFAALFSAFGYIFGGYLGMSLGAMLIWGLYIKISSRFAGQTISASALGTVTSRGMGVDLSKEIYGTMRSAASMISTAATIGTGGAAIGLSALATAGMDDKMAKWAKRDGIEKAQKRAIRRRRVANAAAAAGGAIVGKNQLGRRLLGLYTGLQQQGRGAAGKMNIVDAGTFASPATAALVGSELRQGGALSALYAAQRLKRDAYNRIRQSASEGDLLAVDKWASMQKEEQIQRARLNVNQAMHSKRNSTPLDNMNKVAVTQRRKEALSFNLGLMASDEWDGVKLNSKRSVAMPQMKQVFNAARQYHDASNEEKQRIIERLEAVTGSREGAQKILQLSTTVVAEQDGKKITALDVLEHSYSVTMSEVQTKVKNGEITDLRQLLVGESGTIMDSPFMKMVQRNIATAPGGTAVISNQAAMLQVQEAIKYALAPRVDVPIAQLIKAIDRAYAEGIDPLIAIQENYAIPPDVLRSSEMGRLITELSQHLNPRNASSYGVMLRSLMDASERPEDVSRMSAVMQQYIERNRTDPLVQAFLNPSAHGESAMEAALKLFERMEREGVVTQHDTHIIDRITQRILEQEGGSEIIARWKAIETLSSVPPSLLLRVDPRSPELKQALGGTDPRKFVMQMPIGEAGRLIPVKLAPARNWTPAQTILDDKQYISNIEREIQQTLKKRYNYSTEDAQRIAARISKDAIDLALAEDNEARRIVTQNMAHKLSDVPTGIQAIIRTSEQMREIARKQLEENVRQAVENQQIMQKIRDEAKRNEIINEIVQTEIERKKLSRLTAGAESILGVTGEQVIETYNKLASVDIQRIFEESEDVRQVEEKIRHIKEEAEIAIKQAAERIAASAPTAIHDNAPAIFSQTVGVTPEIADKLIQTLIVSRKIEELNKEALGLKAQEAMAAQAAFSHLLNQAGGGQGQGGGNAGGTPPPVSPVTPTTATPQSGRGATVPPTSQVSTFTPFITPSSGSGSQVPKAQTPLTPSGSAPSISDTPTSRKRRQLTESTDRTPRPGTVPQATDSGKGTAAASQPQPTSSGRKSATSAQAARKAAKQQRIKDSKSETAGSTKKRHDMPSEGGALTALGAEQGAGRELADDVVLEPGRVTFEEAKEFYGIDDITPDVPEPSEDFDNDDGDLLFAAAEEEGFDQGLEEEFLPDGADDNEDGESWLDDFTEL